jgi:gliding motility-associated-like protein
VNLGIFTKPLMRFIKSFMYIVRKLSLSWIKQAFNSLFFIVLVLQTSFVFSQNSECPWVALQEKVVLIGGDPTKEPSSEINYVNIPVNGSEKDVIWKWTELSEITNTLTNYDGLHTQFKFSDPRFSPKKLDRIYQIKYLLTGSVNLPLSSPCKRQLTDTVIIRVLPGIHPYNVITPTSDGKNDIWVIDNISRTGGKTEIYPNAIIKIFDRWGQQIFTSKGNNPQFDALVHPYKVPTGTYMYSIKPDEDYPEVVGELTIIR